VERDVKKWNLQHPMSNGDNFQEQENELQRKETKLAWWEVNNKPIEKEKELVEDKYIEDEIYNLENDRPGKVYEGSNGEREKKIKQKIQTQDANPNKKNSMPPKESAQNENIQETSPSFQRKLSEPRQLCLKHYIYKKKGVCAVCKSMGPPKKPMTNR
jgi:hypothetical protein